MLNTLRIRKIQIHHFDLNITNFKKLIFFRISEMQAHISDLKSHLGGGNISYNECSCPMETDIGIAIM